MARRRASSGLSRSAPPRLWPWLLWALLLLALDQASKQWIVANYQLGDATPVLDFFNIVRAHNTGAAFSFLAQAGGWQRWFFTGLGGAAAVFITWQLRAHPGQRLFCFALSSVLGGAIGNVIDRVVYGHVVDFLDLHWAGWHFPAFNVADSAITVGALCLVLDELLRVRRAD